MSEIGFWYNGMVLSFKEAGVLVHALTRLNLKDSERNKPVTRRQMLYDATYRRYLENSD